MAAPVSRTVLLVLRGSPATLGSASLSLVCMAECMLQVI